MNLQASLLGNISAPPESAIAQKLVARLEPGQIVHMADGQIMRVLAKSASPTGLTFRVNSGGQVNSLSLRHLADLGPVSPSMMRLATFIHSVTSALIGLDRAVKDAIRGAGYPVDESMNWDKYLHKAYTSTLAKITSDPEQIDEMVFDMVVDLLYTKRLLDPKSPYPSHFNPDHPSLAGKPPERKVSAYLVMLFSGQKVSMIEKLKRERGSGMLGESGLQPTDALYQPVGEGDEDNQELREIPPLQTRPEGDQAIEMNGDEEVAEFMHAFRAQVSENAAKKTRKAMLFITDCFMRNIPRKEIKAKMVGTKHFQDKNGEPLSAESYSYILRGWTQLLTEFVTDPESGWAKTSIGRMVLRSAQNFNKTQQEKAKKQPTLAALHLADYTNEPPPPLPPNPVTPPVNPNVQQNMHQNTQPQNNQGLNMAQPEPNSGIADNNGMDPAKQQQPQQQPSQPPKPTIPPEIPGVNHTAASEEQPMPAIKPKAASARPRVAHKFSTLQRIAKEEPAEVGEALKQLTASFTGMSKKFAALASKLTNLGDHLGLNDAAPAKTASIRERVAHRNKFAAELKRIAAEEPQELAQALNDFYTQLEEAITQLDGVVEDVEVLGENMGVDLDTPVSGDDAALALPEPGVDADAEAAPFPAEGTEPAIEV